MSYLIQNINPKDTQPDLGIGISIPFDGNTGFNITYDTKDATRYNLLNYILTNRRERIMNPNIGSNIREQIFENINNNTISNIENIIDDGIKINFPQVKLKELTVYDENNTINIYIKYSIINTNIEDDIQVNFNVNDQ
jgi:phage baseplate assembly protein W